jgi:ADP-ribosylglycohydrolase
VTNRQINREDAVVGCLLGGAIGDALGAFVEGCQQIPSFADIFHQSWHLTDDTQLTLATCEAIIQAGSISPEAIAGNMLRWFRGRRLIGLGASTLKALRDLDMGAHWALAGRQGEYAAGNGAAARVASLAFLLNPESYEDRRTLHDVCRITHHSDEAYAGALAVVAAIQFETPSPSVNLYNFLSSIAKVLPDTRVRDRLLEYASLSPPFLIHDTAIRFGCGGHVVESIPFAIFAAWQSWQLGYEAMIEQVILAGGDTDTNASIAGQITGAWNGARSLPASWIERVPERKYIAEIGRKLASVMGSN